MEYVILDGELRHAGVKGMKWGQRLYQNKDGSLTPLGRLRYGDKKTYAAAKRKATIAAKKKAKAKEEAKAKKKQGETTEEKKERVLKSRSAKELYENAHLFTTKELQDAHFRLQLEKNIKDLAPKEVSKGRQNVEKMIDVMDTSARAIQSGSKLYNGVARVMNAFTDKDLPIIDFGSGKDSKKKGDSKAEKKAEKEEKKAEKKAKKEEKKAEKEEKKAEKEEKKNAKDESEPINPDVIFGSPKSGKKGSKNSKPDDYYDPIDAEWSDVSSSNLPSTYVSSGRSYIDDLFRD